MNKESGDDQLTFDVMQAMERSDTFAFLHNEEDIYTIEDLKEIF
jgi:hypothetical protein